MARAAATWPDGTASFTDYLGSDGVDVCDVPITAHVGVAQYPEDGKQPEPLLRHASTGALLGAYGMQDSANDGSVT